MFGEYCGTTLRQFSKTISYWRNTLFLFLDQFFQLSLLYEVGCIFFDIDNFLIIPKCIFPKSIIWKNADISAIDNFSIISPTWCPPLSVRKCRRLRTRKLRLVLRRKLRTSLPLQPWFVLSSDDFFKVFLILCWLRRRLPQTQGRWRRQRAPMKKTCSSLSRKRTRRRVAGVVARGPGLPTGGTVPANGLQWSRLQWRRARCVMGAKPGRPALTKSRVEYYLVL